MRNLFNAEDGLQKSYSLLRLDFIIYLRKLQV